MKTALVTGASGFVGRHLVPKLQAEGYEVVGIDLTVPAACDDAICGCFEDHHSYIDLRYGRFDVVAHLAANILDVDLRMKQGPRAYKDIALDLTVADYVIRNPPWEAFVWPTSCAVDNPDDPYAWVKLTGEKIFGSLKKQGVRTVMLRPFSGYGSDQALSYPFPAILERVLQKQDPLLVWGSGHQVRDFIHIDDLTDAFMMAIDKFPAYEPIDIGTGRGTDFLMLAAMMSNEVGYYPFIKGMEDKTESSRYRVANPLPAMSYGFQAKISLQEGIRRAIQERQPAFRYNS